MRLAFIGLISIALSSNAFAQTSQDSLVKRSLDLIDYPSYVQQGPVPDMRPRLGIYMNDFPVDSVRARTAGADTIKGNRIWHIAPHWSADNAGLLNGDIVLRVNGRTLADSVYGPDDVLNTRVRSLKIGDTLNFEIIRDRSIRHVPVVLTGGKRSIVPFKGYASLGEVRKDTWLQQTLAANGITAEADTIAKQLAAIADMDFCDAPFTSRPHPFRLNAVTYLDHHPLRTGALSRVIDTDVWQRTDSLGIRGALDAAAIQLDLDLRGHLPAIQPSIEGIKAALIAVQSSMNAAYQPIRHDLDTLSLQLAGLLDPGSDWEAAMDSIQDPVMQLQARTRLEDRLKRALGGADKVDLNSLVNAAEILTSMADTVWLQRFSSSFADKKTSSRVKGVEGDIMLTWSTPQGACVIGGRGANRYSGDFAFIFDPGGADIYDLPSCKPGAFRFIADMNGNDIYRGDRSAASGVGCIDVLVDVNGDDVYSGSSWSQGAGCLGIGILADYSGDDTYTGHWCMQGAAFVGIGIHYDLSGSDQRSSDLYSQGFGYAKGFGALLDREGNDSYRAGWKYPDSRWPNRAHLSMSQGFGYGMRPWSTGVGTDGGIGLLSDRQGDDVYNSDYFSQGGSYWYGLGILHDWHGADRYSAGQYSQGSGIHLSFGALLDDQGDDSYDAYAWLEQGNAHDWSAGCLEDQEGNDTYRSSGASQGCGFFVSFAYLLDAKGDDRYYIKPSDTTNSQGGGNYIPPRNSGSLGILLDLGKGDDVFTDPRIIPGEPVVKSQRGVAYDDGSPAKK